ncbi:MAG: DUF4405 domain-containing protein [Spirochaetes bacterium]|nr:DUF4405 domain-containing protein [Spirochaetota bacterium]
MNKSDTIHSAAKKQFYLNLFNLALFLLLAITGLLLQVNYHMHHLPNGREVLGLNRHGWLLLHKLSAVMSLAGITAHCLLHRRYIATTTRRIIARRSLAKVPSSYYTVVLYVLASLTALIPWIFFGQGHGHGGGRRFVEIHDKLTLLLIIVTAAHIISRAGRMWNTAMKMAYRNANSPKLDPLGEQEVE